MGKINSLEMEMFLNKKMNFNGYLSFIQRFYEINDIHYWISEDDLSNLLKIYFKMCRDDDLTNHQKKYLNNQIFRLFLLVRYRTSVMIENLKKEKNAGILFEKIYGIKEEKKKVSNFFKKCPELSERLDKLKIDDDFKNALSLRRMINSSQTFSPKDKKILLDEIDELLNVIIMEDNLNTFLRPNMAYADFKEIITLSKSNPSNYAKIKEWIFLNKDSINEDTYKRTLKLFNINITDEIIDKIYDLICNNSSLEGMHLEIVMLDTTLNNELSFDSLRKMQKIILILEHDQEMNQIKKMLLEKFKIIMKKVDNEPALKTILSDKDFFNRRYEEKVIKNINTVFPRRQRIYNKTIFTIDEAFSPDLDSAFSITDLIDAYDFDIYITDVPTFLLDNRELAQIAYQNAMTYYVRDIHGYGNYNIDMLPVYLSHKLLSLKGNYPQNVIHFNFIISKNGEILFTDVSLNNIIVGRHLTKDGAERVLKDEKHSLHKDLNLLKEMCNVLCAKSKLPLLHRLNSNRMEDLVAVPSVLVNYFIGQDSHFAIYRDKGHYTKEKKEYTHSATPLRRIVSDINLGLYLNQIGLIRIDNRDIYKITDNVDEIVRHLNEREDVERYIDSHGKQMRKMLHL